MFDCKPSCADKASHCSENRLCILKGGIGDRCLFRLHHLCVSARFDTLRSNDVIAGETHCGLEHFVVHDFCGGSSWGWNSLYAAAADGVPAAWEGA